MRKEYNVSYIAFLDMLGTTGFCRNPDEYYEKISKFNIQIHQCSIEIGDTGKIGVFSDSAYVESTSLRITSYNVCYTKLLR